MIKIEANINGLNNWVNDCKNDLIERVTDKLNQVTVGLCYDLIGATMPFPKGSEKGGGTDLAFQAGLDRVRDSIDIIFKPINELSFGTLVANRDWESVRSYNFEFRSEKMQEFYDNEEYDKIYNIFRANGWEPDESREIIDDATLEILQSARNQKLESAKYYVRNKSSIERLKGSMINQIRVGFMAGGWLTCANELGGVQDEYTKSRKPIWMYGKGDGYTSISSDRLTIEINNSFGNFGGWGSSNQVQEALGRRKQVVKMAFEDIEKRPLLNGKMFNL